MRRILLVLAVVMLSVAIMVASAMPALANPGGVPAASPEKPGQNGGGPPANNFTPESGSYVSHGGGGDTCVFHFGNNFGEQTGGGAGTCAF